MSEDPPSSSSHRTWFGRLTQALSGEPQSREELIEELRHAQANGLLSNDTLSMIEGAIKVAELTVADVMVPRADRFPADRRAAKGPSRHRHRVGPFAFSGA